MVKNVSGHAGISHRDPNRAVSEPPPSSAEGATGRHQQTARGSFDALPTRAEPTASSKPSAFGEMPPTTDRRSALIHKFRGTLPMPPRPDSTPVLQYDRTPGTKENFRSSDEFELPESCNPAGWHELHVSGSASIASLDQVAKLDPSPQRPVTVLDVREESHVIVGGYPGTWRAPNNWGNVGKPSSEVLADERARIQQLRSQETIQLSHRKDAKEGVENPRSVTLVKPEIMSEEELVKKAGADYVRLTVTDHLGPRSEHVDAFVKMERAMAAHERLHVHCGVGQGRTGIFIAMHDMLRNASKVPLDDIIARQLAFNPGRALDFGKDVTHEGRGEFRNDRLEFITLFYEYAKVNPQGSPQLWSEWLDTQSSGDAERVAHGGRELQ
ncbi:hypothetical protein M5C99_08290 [Acidovorax sp. NCPPB 2350]|nr:hypothetical protein M5C99_08290 [Acidovorax sp. NCPPB 2350]